MVNRGRLCTWRFGTALLAALLLHGAVSGQVLERPEGPVVLSILGNVTQTNAAQKAGFDMKMLEKLPQKTFTTQTPWYPQPITFTGPLLRDVLNAVGAKGCKLVAVALNDYKTDIPLSDAFSYDVIIARLMNDRPMPLREKGLLFIVYPFDANPELKGEIYTHRSAWQLTVILVK